LSWDRLFSQSYRVALADFALKHRLPGMFGTKAYVEVGGLMSYGADIKDLHRRAATYIDKIRRSLLESIMGNWTPLFVRDCLRRMGLLSLWRMAG
jgi:hypothetical protein